MLGSCRIKIIMFLGNSHVDDASLVIGVNQFISSLPLPISSILLRSLTINPADQAGDGDPEDERDDDDSAHNIILEKLEEAADADLIKDLPDPDHVLAGLLTLTLVTEALEAWSSIRQNIHWSHSIARTVEIPPATSLTRVS